ncbi:16S rRNA (cytosine(967)-C(5))-methyltransferase RsmB [Colwellia sp. MEBiC06753]
MSVNLRGLAAQICFGVVDKGRSLSEELPKYAAKVEGKDKGLLQELCYGVLRYLPELECHIQQLMEKPLKGKQRVCHFLLLVGIYQLKYTRIPDHAAVSETVAATSSIKLKFLKNLVNAILRSYQRDPDLPENTSLAISHNHPGWFIKKLQSTYPQQWQQILNANMQRPPMWLRVNQAQSSSDDYLALLANTPIEVDAQQEKTGAIRLVNAVDVDKLPNFAKGMASIQDAAAQQSARLLDCQAGDIVLDCCAAPGGKTCHILEMSPNIASLTAIDIEESRLKRVQENLDRIGVKAKLQVADATAPEQWWDGSQFDRILLDAPCSATGVIRRHPDIKWLRKSQDIDALVILQAEILKKMWSLLKPGGTLLYATCSVLPEENAEQISQFIAEEPSASLIDLPEYQGKIGWQILPGEDDMDGFYYAKLLKAL